MRVFLTGATGYVGSQVAACLVDAGHELAVAVRGERDDAAARRLGAWPIRATPTALDRLREVAGEADAIVHCAASDRPGFAAVNDAAIDAMLDGLRPGCGFVMPGSTLVFGDTGATAFDGTEPLAPPPGLACRAATEDRILRAGAARGLRTALVYAALAYGYGPGAALPTLLARCALAAGWVGVPAGCSPVWSSVHVADWAALIVAAVSHAPVGGTPLVAAGASWALHDVAALLAAGLGGLPLRPVEREAAPGLWGRMGPALFTSQHFTAARAARMLGWAPVEENLEEALADLACALAGGVGRCGQA